MAEARRDKDARQTRLVRRKVDATPYPLQNLRIKYANQTKGKSYSEEEDRFLLVMLAKYGIGKGDETHNKIKRDISEFPAFRFDWFIKSRTPIELARRCTTLVHLVDKEFEQEDGGVKTKRPAAVSAVAKGKVRVTLSTLPVLVEL